jgi:hypothetical protein
MEQQTVSVAKAGIIATLNARTSVLASANPVGSRYNPRLSIVDNIHLPPSLISRFDLIYLVLDKAEEANDRRLARHLLSLHYETAQSAAQVCTSAGVLFLACLSSTVVALWSEYCIRPVSSAGGRMQNGCVPMLPADRLCFPVCHCVCFAGMYRLKA